jgi:hypothetical protein
MRLFLAVLGVLILAFGGLVVYAYILPAPQGEAETIISDDQFPR